MRQPPWENPYRISSEKFLRMIERGIFEDGEKLELLDGSLVVKEPQGPPHAAIAARLAMELGPIYVGTGHVRTHSPVRSGEYSLPEPDVAVIRGHPRDYIKVHPAGRNIIFVIELSDTTRSRDRAKVRIYGGGRVPVYWLVDLPKRRVEVRSHPGRNGEYRDLAVYGAGDRIPLPERDESLAAAVLFP